MNNPKLTIGMACHDDYHGAVFTCQSLALHHALHDWEIVIVDNNPGSAHGKETAKFAASVSSRKDGLIRYVPMPEGGGTSQPRNRVFAEARGEIVVCMDAHVLLAPGSLDALLAWYEAHPDSLDLMQGPLIYDDLGNFSTHFDETWRSEMEGTWQTDPRGADPAGEPFDIAAQGLGFFACRRDAWLGFNENFREFGAEECYIHRKFRQAGRRTLCHPGIRWWHRFGRPDGARYRASRYGKVRNYVLGRQELGLDLTPIHAHFVSLGHPGESLRDHLVREHGVDPKTFEGHADAQLELLHRKFKISQQEWDYLVADPVAHVAPPGVPVTIQPKAPAPTLDELFAKCKLTPRDLDQHAETIRRYAAQSKSVTAFVKRQEWNALLAAGRPRSLVIHQTEEGPLLGLVHAAVQAEATRPGEERSYTTHVGPAADSLAAAPAGEVDLLVIDTVHHADRLAAELSRHAGQARRIMCRGTAAFGVRSEDGKGEGLYAPLRQWIADHPEWFVCYHTTQQYGLTVLSRDERDRPESLIHVWPVGHGPGTELKAALKSLGIEPTASCDCNSKAEQMDRWGVEGCRERREQIIGWLREGSDRWGWSAKLGSAAKAVLSGLAFKLNPLDPYPGLVDECIRRAAKQEAKEAA